MQSSKQELDEVPSNLITGYNKPNTSEKYNTRKWLSHILINDSKNLTVGPKYFEDKEMHNTKYIKQKVI